MLYYFNFKENIYNLNKNEKGKKINLLLYLLILASFIYIIKLLIYLLIAVSFL